MSHKVNLVRVLTAATGNSTPITLGAAYSQLFMTPAEAGAMNGRTYSYNIVDGNDWEIGKGVYTSSGTTLARTTILASRISGTLGTTRISLSGTAQVRFVESAEDMDGVRGTRAVTGTSDVIANSDQGYVVTYSNASAIAVTLAQASASNLFLDGWSVIIRNSGAGTITITPATSTINGASTLAIPSNQAVRIVSDGTDYKVYYMPATAPLLAVNNLSDGTAATMLTNLGGTTVGKALFTATDAAAARTAAGVGTGAAASKSDQQTGTDNTVAVTPAHQQDHDSADKVKGYFTQTGGAYTKAFGYNIASFTKNSTGNITINFTVPFANTSFGLLLTINQFSAVSNSCTIQEVLGSRSASSVTVQIAGTGSSGVATDFGFSIAAFGRQ